MTGGVEGGQHPDLRTPATKAEQLFTGPQEVVIGQPCLVRKASEGSLLRRAQKNIKGIKEEFATQFVQI